MKMKMKIKIKIKWDNFLKCLLLIELNTISTKIKSV